MSIGGAREQRHVAGRQCGSKDAVATPHRFTSPKEHSDMHDTTTPASTRRRRRRIAAALVAGVAAFGTVGASAASLGGITGTSLGADTAVIGSCDTDGVTLAYTNAYDATSGRYQTTGVTVNGIAAACAGKTMSLTLKDAAGASLGSGTVASISGTSAAVSLAAPGANAATVAGAAVVISG